MNIIVAVDKKYGIGLGNRLLTNIKQDMDFFKEMTLDKIVVMGHNTFYSLKGGQPLKNRINVILTKDKSCIINDAIVCNNIFDLKNTLKQFNTKDVFVIGGEQIYNQLIGYCEVAYITKIDEVFFADAHFPNIDEMVNWELVSEIKDGALNFCTYKNRDVKSFL